MTKENGNGENNGIPAAIKKLSPWLKIALTLLTIAAFMGAGIWQLNSTYAFKSELKTVEVSAEKGRQLLAEKSVETFNIFQRSYKKDQEIMRQEQQREQVKRDIRFWQQQLDTSYANEREIRNTLNKRPNDSYLQNKLSEEQRKQQLYRDKVSDLLR